LSDDVLASVFTEPGTTTFTEELVTDIWHDAIPLMCANHAEVGGLPQEHFDPALSIYQGIEAGGALKTYAARIDGKLFGYAVFALTPHPHYPTLKIATADVVYVVPEHRGRRSIRFLLWVKRQLKAAGAHFWGLQNPVSNDWSSTLRMLGLAPIETFYIGDLR
jgi:hypothetical protein